MAAKKGSTSSKTAHVLNLLGSASKAEPEQPAQKEETPLDTSTPQVQHQEQEPQAEVEEKQEVKQEIKSENTQSRHLSPPILEVARTNHNAISESIHNALEDALRAELKEQQGLEVPQPRLAEEASQAVEPEIAVAEEASQAVELAPAVTEEPKEAAALEPAVAEEASQAVEPAPAVTEEPKEAVAPEPADAEEVKTAEVLQPADAAEVKTAETPQPADAEEVKTAEAPQPADAEEVKTAEAPQPADVEKVVIPQSTAVMSEAEPEHFYDQLEDGSEFVNVMQILVEEKIEKYVKMFKLCQCPRCMSDVEALALSRLPAQYVVLPSKNKVPLLSVYRSKFDSQVTTQIIYACKEVMQDPRH